VGFEVCKVFDGTITGSVSDTQTLALAFQFVEHKDAGGHPQEWLYPVGGSAANIKFGTVMMRELSRLEFSDSFNRFILTPHLPIVVFQLHVEGMHVILGLFQ